MTSWTYDVVSHGSSDYPVAYINVSEDRSPGDVAHTVDLQGAHVMLDVDEAGTVVGIEILGPAVYTKLADLGNTLKATPVLLNDENDPEG